MSMNYPQGVNVKEEVIGTLKNLAESHGFMAEYLAKTDEMRISSEDIEVVFDISDEETMYDSFVEAVRPYLSRNVNAPKIDGRQTWNLSMIHDVKRHDLIGQPASLPEGAPYALSAKSGFSADPSCPEQEFLPVKYQEENEYEGFENHEDVHPVRSRRADVS